MDDLSYRLPRPPKRKRFDEPLKFVPVVYVLTSIFTLWFIYVFYHCVPMLQLDVRKERVDKGARERGQWQCIIFQPLTLLLLISYARAIMVSPGEIPDDDEMWQYPTEINKPVINAATIGLQEMKRTGDRRHCKWCGKYKPDRCHHCRPCRSCVLKMDHHCPWIYNCVGFRNYKFFFLLLFYSTCCCHMIVWTMLESATRAVDEPQTPIGELFVIVFGETIAAFLGIIITGFYSFHVWLMFKAMTTIEFCEKYLSRNGEKKTFDAATYDQGPYGNIKAVLGDNPLLFFSAHQSTLRKWAHVCERRHSTSECPGSPSCSGSLWHC